VTDNSAADNAAYHIVFLKRATLLVRRPGADWRALQEEFLDYKSSLGPWTLAEAATWIVEEYGANAERDADIVTFGAAKESALSL
jgi:hypothetical protein